MVRLWAVVAVVCLWAGTAGAQSEAPKLIKLSPKQVAVIKKEVASKLKDYTSARFEAPFLAAQMNEAAIGVCGFVNGKNSYGAYAGNTPFSGVLGVKGEGFFVTGFGSSDGDRAGVYYACEKTGTPLR
ncbi:hypothetical protein [Methylorubrum salsuginis]|uniref:Uncharacterized protein n=1 Tax=Methylorubrum salsuginis TaxID=414703 RepID=A0A1I4FLE9_9HYPH|nr:hypothetical protein [Methylorubrum salsuginis]SFL18732.1 hypothetical protein SAMN04488125_110105 [Methylorubrum salsuginis]